jgi:hypothetical protein
MDLEFFGELYFDSCFQEVTKSKGSGKNKVTWTEEVRTRPYTITGLCIALGIERRTLLGYKRRDPFFRTYARLKQKCMEYAEEQLFIGKNPHGAMFYLQNNSSYSRESKHFIEQKTEHKHQMIDAPQMPQTVEQWIEQKQIIDSKGREMVVESPGESDQTGEQ